MVTMPIGNFLTTTEAAEVIGVSSMRVRQFAKENRLHSLQVGNILVFEKEEVKKFAKTPRKWGRPHSKKK
jgi:excisionase family DNA binding protein